MSYVPSGLMQSLNCWRTVEIDNWCLWYKCLNTNIWTKIHFERFYSYVFTDTWCSISLNGFYIFSQSELNGPHHLYPDLIMKFTWVTPKKTGNGYFHICQQISAS